MTDLGYGSDSDDTRQELRRVSIREQWISLTNLRRAIDPAQHDQLGINYRFRLIERLRQGYAALPAQRVQDPHHPEMYDANLAHVEREIAAHILRHHETPTFQQRQDDRKLAVTELQHAVHQSKISIDQKTKLFKRLFDFEVDLRVEPETKDSEVALDRKLFDLYLDIGMALDPGALPDRGLGR